MCDSNHDPCRIYNEKMVMARKVHECCECEEKIVPGDHYIRIEILDHDECWMRYKICIPCLAIGMDLASGYWFFGQLRECIKECCGFDYLI